MRGLGSWLRARVAARRTIFEVCKVAGVRFKTIPGVDQLIDGTVSVSQIRDVNIASRQVYFSSEFPVPSFQTGN